MNRMLKALHVAKEQETVSGFVQIVFVAVVVAGTLGITALLKQTADTGPAVSGAPEQLVVDVLQPAPEAHTALRQLTGQVESRADVAISPQVTGRVIAVHDRLIPGGELAAGEVLFALDPTDYEIALERSRADVASAEAELEQAEADADNFIKDWRRVYPDREPPALVAKEPQIRAIRARLAAARASVRLAETNLERTRITAKNRIRIIESTIELDQLVVPGGQYGSFYVKDALRIRASAESSIVADLGLAPGKTVGVRTDGPSERQFEAAISSIGAALDDRTRLLPLIIEVPEDVDLAPGVFVMVSVRGDETDGVFKLPASAMASRTSVWRVASGRLEEVEVGIVDTADNFVVVRAFNTKDGIVISQVPTSFVERPVKIRNTVENRERAAALRDVTTLMGAGL